MELEVIDKHDNLLLERTEVNLKATHPKESTPKRKDLNDGIKELLGLKKETIVIDSITGEFGRGESRIFAKVYKDVKKARGVERDFILKRNGLWEEKKKEKKEEGKKE